MGHPSPSSSPPSRHCSCPLQNLIGQFFFTPFELICDLFRTLFKYREYLRQSVARDLKKLYKRSALGYLWSMLNPLFMMIVLTIVFSKIMRIEVQHYSVFLFVALLPWQYFSQTVLGSIDSVRANMKIIEHLPIPKYIFALSLSFSNLANFFLAIIPLFAVMLFVGRSFSFSILALPIVLLPLMFVSIGSALFFATVNVFFDDTRHLLNVFLQALYYLTPILYGIEHLPPSLAGWLQLNPMYHVIYMMRTIFYYGELPSLYTLSIAYGSSFLVLLLGLWVFKKADNKFMYFV